MSEGGSPTTLLVAADSQQDAKGNVRKMEDIEADIARLQAEKAAIPREAQLKQQVEEEKARDHATRDEPVAGSREEQLRKQIQEESERDWASRT